MPEYDLELPKTQGLILDALEGLDLEITLGKELSSVTAVLRGGRGPGPVVLLRGDMDALPVTERVDVPFVSTAPRDDACLRPRPARRRAGRRGEDPARPAGPSSPGDVVFMFQPGEETTGGAPIMIREGVLDAAGRRVDAAYCLHVQSAGDPLGMWSSKPGPLMAAADQLHVRVVGAGAHGSDPYRGKDPIPVLCEMVVALQTMVTRQFDVFDPVVLTVGRIAGGTKENIIPDDAFFDATVRTFSAETRAKVQEAVDAAGRGPGRGARADGRGGLPGRLPGDGQRRARSTQFARAGDRRPLRPRPVPRTAARRGAAPRTCPTS